MMRIEKAAVLGAGTMGAQIAAHLANAGVPTLLLDIAPRELAPEEQAKGLKLESREVRNRIARNGLEGARKSKPAAFFTPETASLVAIGNFDDDLAKLKDCDLILEAVVENLAIKRSLFERIEAVRKPGSIVASNTSGIPIHFLAEGRSEDFRQHFLGVHFFNPPRYLHLVEIIRTEWTKPEVSCFMFGFLDQRLGKGVVPAKDRPNFIANRVGTFGALFTIKTMLEDGYSIEEVDKITEGQRWVVRKVPPSAPLISLVSMSSPLSRTLYEPTEDEERECSSYRCARQDGRRGLLGDKTKSGFYQKRKGETDKREIWALDTATLEYRPSER
jgi:3-hydroxyacyl-CoA dehydrogenase